MLEFEDPDAKYNFKDSKKDDGPTKLRILTVFLVFVLLVFVLAENNYRFDLLKTTVAPIIIDCNPLYNFSSSRDKAVMAKNAKKVLQDNLKRFEQMEGFEQGQVKTTQESHMVPEIVLEFKDAEAVQKKIPKKMCGFDVTVTND